MSFAQNTAEPARVYEGGWILVRESGGSRAFQVGDGTEIELVGELDRCAWSAPEGLRRFQALHPKLGELADVLDAGELEPTLSRLLAPRGFEKLFVELTGRCNERCLHCYASSSPEVDAELEREVIERVVRQAKALGFRVIQFTGGDPLISKHLRVAVDTARALEFEEIEVYTNGLAFTREMAEHFRARRVSMAFSVYSHDAAVHDAVTGTHDSHVRTLRAIRFAVEAHLTLRVSVILRDENRDDTEKVRNLLFEIGVTPEQVGVDRERPVGRGHWQEDAPIPEGEMGLTHAIGSQEPGAKLAINYHGEVVPCVFDRQTVLGRIREQSLEQILAQRVSGREVPRRTLALFPEQGEPLACFDCRERRSVLSRFTWGST